MTLDGEARNAIPSREYCFRLMDRYGMLANIRAHSILVARIAEVLSIDLVRAGSDLIPEIAVTGALLHDIAKTICLNNDRDHARVGRDICLEHRLDAIAPIVAEHVILRDYSPAGTITEKEIVYYADKRVNHDQVVSLNDRLEYIITTYGRDNPRIQAAIEKNYARCRQLEARIFELLDFAPESLADRLVGQATVAVPSQNG